jgi:hypothetical protein
MTSPLTEAALEELSRLEGKATVGPWMVLDGSWCVVQRAKLPGGQDGAFVAECEEEFDGEWDPSTIGQQQRQWADNAALLVALRNVAPALIAMALRASTAERRERERAGESAAFRAIAQACIDWCKDTGGCHFCTYDSGKLPHEDWCPVREYEQARQSPPPKGETCDGSGWTDVLSVAYPDSDGNRERCPDCSGLSAPGEKVT